eukprot:TRINITY_DN3299_c0_g1_i2.p1 TRINITY_DN3299_c0_g1~~TRINITY_DN3299_c0_g1_i2.p1  ORF type:complete len:258 (+),score=83.27 TRINITY_DN3299_c0_g1_i2:34-807(+)
MSLINRQGPRDEKPGVESSGDEADKDVIVQPPRTMLTKALRIMAIAGVIPVVYFIPSMLTWGAIKVRDNRMPLIYLWVAYAAAILFIFFYLRRKTITSNSLATVITTWAIFSLGAYSLVDIPRMVEIHLRRDVLVLWLSLTMVFNVIYLVMDDTPYQEAEALERAKEERRRIKEEEWQKRRDEKRKVKDDERRKKRDAKLGPIGKAVVNASIYIAIFVVVAYVCKNAYEYYIRFHEDLEMRNMPVDATIPDEYSRSE